MADSILDLTRQPWIPANDRGLGSTGGSVPWWQTPVRGLGNSSPLLTPFAIPSAPNPNSLSPLSPGGTTATGSSVGPFTAETLVKNPELANILKKLYGDIGNISTDPNVNQTVLQKNVKDPGVEAAGQAALTQQQADAHNNAQSIADFAKSYMAAQPEAQARAEQEAANIGRVQSGALAADLAANQRSSDINSTQNLMRRLGALAGTQNLGDLSRGGVTNSNANANILQAAAQASLARDAASLAGHRQNLMDVQNLQIGTAGLPQRILDAVLQRQLTPIQAGQASSAADLNRLQAISGLLAGNSVFTPQSRSGMIQQIQQLLGAQANIDPSAYYRFVRGDFPNQYPGAVRQQDLSLPPISGGGYSGMNFQDILAALQAGGGGAPGAYGVPGAQPFINAPGDLTPAIRARAAAPAPVPRLTPAPNPMRDALFNDYTSGTGSSNNASAIMNWLYQLSPEQLAGVPAGGFE